MSGGIDIRLLLLWCFLRLAASLRRIHEDYLLVFLDSVLILAGTASLARTAAATGALERRGAIERLRVLERRLEVTGAGQDVGVGAKVIVRLDVAASARLVGLLGQLEHLAKLHALVGLHRTLNVSEPCITLSTLRHLLHLQQNLLQALRFFNEPGGGP